MRMNEYPLALVTGGARRLGRSFALALARHGYAILLHYYHSSDAAASVAEEIRSLGIPVNTFEADLTDPTEIESLFSTIDSLNFRMSVLINSAAGMKRADLAMVTSDEWDATLNLNLRAPLLLAQRSAERMVDGGLIVNITDAGTSKTWTGYPAYLVSKAGLEVLTRLLARTYAPKIRVNAIAPGLVQPSADMSTEKWTKLVNRLPLKHTVSSEDITSSLDFLLKNKSVTGQTIVVDGGYSLL
jgi:NAD(P)-dependent dehydrogenase (short-subunit alcohol dehydrogenase family)